MGFPSIRGFGIRVPGNSTHVAFRGARYGMEWVLMKVVKVDGWEGEKDVIENQIDTALVVNHSRVPLGA